MRTFKQLSQQDRVYISRLNARGMSISRIAVRLGVHKSTISRELRRNAQVSDTESQIFWIGVYNLWSRTEVLQYLEKLKAQGHPGLEPKRFWNASIAQDKRNRRLYLANQLRRRKSSETAKWVIQKLKEHWSPDQIAGRSKIAGPQPVSHEYVYQLIIQDKKNGGTLYRLLKRFRKRKQRFAKRTYGPVIPNRVSIENRPAIASTRSRLGDLEGDLVQGYCSDGYVLSVIDRKSRLLTLRKLRAKKKQAVRKQLEFSIRKMGEAHTLTLDNGSEFCDHEKLTETTKTPVFFCHPYSSSERGSIENANGLLRYFLPKKTPFKNLSQSHLNKLQSLLNNRPRKCLGYLTPVEVHSNQPSRLPERTSHPKIVAFDS